MDLLDSGRRETTCVLKCCLLTSSERPGTQGPSLPVEHAVLVPTFEILLKRPLFSGPLLVPCLPLPGTVSLGLVDLPHVTSSRGPSLHLKAISSGHFILESRAVYTRT